MPKNTISQVAYSGQFLTEEHFSGNAVYTRNTVDGVPDDSFIEAVTALDMGVLRYPAGQPDIAYANGLVIDGALPQHLVSFLDACRENNLDVVIVTPILQAYQGADELKIFTNLLLEDYGDLIHAFEIGNEYWNNQTETEYGKIANDSVIAINSAIENHQAQIDIWVQMGDAGGRMSSFNGVEGGWIGRNIDANEAIIAELSSEAKSFIDGVVEHYYFRVAEQYFEDLNASDQNIRLDYSIWKDALDQDITLNITEWNIRTSNYYQLGMRAASTMIEQIEFLISIEVDELYVWPPQHNTSSDLAGSNQVIYDPVTGIVTNTVGGAVFDLMSSSLVGMQRIEVEENYDSHLINSHVFASEQRVVVYVTSRSNETEGVSFSLGDFWFGASLVSAVQIGYDKESSDGKYYHYGTNTWEQADSVLVDGEIYVLNEHDVNADVYQHEVEDLVDGNDVVFELQPYEVIELTFDLPPGEYISGTEEIDRLSGSDEIDVIMGYAGDDVVTAGGENDFVSGGAGDDYLDSGSGSDYVDGGVGSDTLRGWGGGDTLKGGDGNDFLDGWFGEDFLFGGAGNDLLTGGAGNDSMYGGTGADTLEGEDGKDVISGESSTDILYGGAGEDTLMGGIGADTLHGGDGDDSILGNTGVDLIYGGNGNDWISSGNGVDIVYGDNGHDTIIGRTGWDTLKGGEGDDALYGSEGRDALHGDSGDDFLSGGHGFDTLHGGDGNDTLYGNIGEDVIYGEAGNDALYGATGDDFLMGGSGNDTLFGAQGRDTLEGGAGNDFLRGGTLGDIFIFERGHGSDIVSGLDLLDQLHLSTELTNGLTNSADIVEQFETRIGGRVALSFGGGDEIIFDTDVTTAQLIDSMYLL